MKGKVWIVGAGSEAGLITVRGLEAVRGAQVLVYDDLLDRALLEEAPEECEKICVGKRKNLHKKEQDQIHEILLDRALRGVRVVRLKGGDPTVFGRGGEEALALQEAGIDYELVPGVSSCICAPEHFGIPVTHRGLASSFTVVTGHGAGKTAESLHVLAGIRGTLVCLMGHSRAAEIAEGLIEAGMDPQTPASVLSRAYMPGEKRVDGKLENLEEMAGQVQAPAVIVIGKTAGLDLRAKTAAIDISAGSTATDVSAGHAFPRTALVAGTRSFTGKMAAALREDGVRALEFPCMQIIPQAGEIPGDRELGQYDWLVFTSANGVRVFLEEMFGRRTDLRILGRTRIACIGEGTARALQEAHLYADLVPEDYTSEALADALIRSIREDAAKSPEAEAAPAALNCPEADAAPKAEKILILRAVEGNPLLTNKLENEKILYKDCGIYRARYCEPGAELCEPGTEAAPCEPGTGAALYFDRDGETAPDIDLVIFGSAGGVRAFLEKHRIREKAQAFCIGARTAAEFERLTGRKAVVSESCSVEGLRRCVRTWGK